jgi:hypothetical protein
MRLLNDFKKQYDLSRDMLDYITWYKKMYKNSLVLSPLANYTEIYKRVIKDATKKNCKW